LCDAQRATLLDSDDAACSPDFLCRQKKEKEKVYGPRKTRRKMDNMFVQAKATGTKQAAEYHSEGAASFNITLAGPATIP
jgi:hypothetical protein